MGNKLTFLHYVDKDDTEKCIKMLDKYGYIEITDIKCDKRDKYIKCRSTLNYLCFKNMERLAVCMLDKFGKQCLGKYTKYVFGNVYYDTALTLALKNKMNEVISKLLDEYPNGCDINFISRYGYTALDIAIEYGLSEFAIRIIDIMSPKLLSNEYLGNGCTPLIRAILNKMTNVAIKLLDYPNYLSLKKVYECNKVKHNKWVYKKYTPLTLALSNGMYDVAKKILGTNYHAVQYNSTDGTALQLACLKKQTKIINMILNVIINDNNIINPTDETQVIKLIYYDEMDKLNTVNNAAYCRILDHNLRPLIIGMRN